MRKIDTDFNLNVLLKLFFSLSKKIIFFSSILGNNNLPLKIYCESIVKILRYHFLLSFFFPFFFPLFLSYTHYRISFFFFFLFFPFFFSPPHTYPYTFLFLLLSSFYPYHFLQTPKRSSSPSDSIFFFSPALRLQHPCNSSPWSSWFFSFSLNSTAYKRDDSDWEDWIRAE